MIDSENLNYEKPVFSNELVIYGNESIGAHAPLGEVAFHTIILPGITIGDLALSSITEKKERDKK